MLIKSHFNLKFSVWDCLGTFENNFLHSKWKIKSKFYNKAFFCWLKYLLGKICFVIFKNRQTLKLIIHGNHRKSWKEHHEHVLILPEKHRQIWNFAGLVTNVIALLKSKSLLIGEVFYSTFFGRNLGLSL